MSEARRHLWAKRRATAKPFGSAAIARGEYVFHPGTNGRNARLAVVTRISTYDGLTRVFGHYLYQTRPRGNERRLW